MTSEGSNQAQNEGVTDEIQYYRDQEVDEKSDWSGNEDADVASEDVASNVSTHAHYDNEDTVTVQFSSICSPFLATSHIPCSQSYHIRTTHH